MWDTPHVKKSQNLSPNFYKNADGIILVYDMCNKQSFDMITSYFKYIHDNCDGN